MKDSAARKAAVVMAVMLPGLFAACAADGGPRLETSWTGADTGTISVPATGEWCAKGRHVEIRAARGDTGVAVALFPTDSAPNKVVGVYKVIKGATDSSRPTAAVAMRWSDPAYVSGFRSDSGTVTVRRGVDGALEGDVKTSGPMLGGLPRRIQVTASFRGIAVDTTMRDCTVLLPRRDTTRDSTRDTLRRTPRDTVPLRIPRTAVDSLRDSLLRLRLDSKDGRDLLQKRLRTQGSGGGAPHR